MLISAGLLMFCRVYVQTQATVSFWAALQRNDKIHILLLCFATDNECRKGCFLSYMREGMVFNKLVTERQDDAVLS